MEITIIALELDREVTQWATEIKIKCKIRIRIGWDLTQWVEEMTIGRILIAWLGWIRDQSRFRKIRII